jgi:hypothetical protein
MEGIMKSGLVALAFIMYVPAIAGGQAPTVAAGARVRVTAPSNSLDKHVTTILDIRPDSLVIGDEGGSSTISLADVTALDVSTGRPRRILRDAALGFGIGAVAGAVIGAVTYEECVPQSFLDCFMAHESASEAAVEGGAVLGAVGLLTGAVVGVFHRSDRWARVDLPIRAAIEPTRSGGIAVRLTRAF